MAVVVAEPAGEDGTRQPGEPAPVAGAVAQRLPGERAQSPGAEGEPDEHDEAQPVPRVLVDGRVRETGEAGQRALVAVPVDQEPPAGGERDQDGQVCTGMEPAGAAAVPLDGG